VPQLISAVDERLSCALVGQQFGRRRIVNALGSDWGGCQRQPGNVGQRQARPDRTEELRHLLSHLSIAALDRDHRHAWRLDVQRCIAREHKQRYQAAEHPESRFRSSDQNVDSHSP